MTKLPRMERKGYGLGLALILLAGCGEKGTSQTQTNPPAKETPAPSSPAPELTLHTFQEAHMGTQFTMRVWADPAETETVKTVVADAFSRAEELEQTLSDYRPDSEVNALCRTPAGTPVKVSPVLYDVLSRSLTLSQETDGAFDATVGPLVRLWKLTRKNGQLPDPAKAAEALTRTGWEKVSLSPQDETITLSTDGMQLDFGGIAKGYTSDAILKHLREQGFPRALVAASGDIALGEPPPGKDGWRVGIENLDVENSGALTGTVLLRNAAISTSGDFHQFVELDGVRYSHIVNPRTGLGLTERIGVTIIAPNATTSDSYATAVSVMGRERGLNFIEKKAGVECLIFEMEESSSGEAEPKLLRHQSSGFPEIQEAELPNAGSKP